MADLDSTDGDEIEALFHTTLECEPVLMPQAVDDVEARFRAQEFGITRRIGLAICTKSSHWFKELSEKKDMAQTFTEPLENLREHIEWLKKLTTVLECALTLNTMVQRVNLTYRDKIHP